MPVNLHSTAGYLYLDSWILSNIIQLGTASFCQRFLTKDIDPCGRWYDQMTQAARSGQANIAEGAARHQTSTETEMRLTDVARASIAELSSDFMQYLMLHRQAPWSQTDPRWRTVRSLRLEPARYSDDLMHDVALHILAQKQRFDEWIESPDALVAANTLLLLCGRLMKMLTRQLQNQLDGFKQNGGFSENLTDERLTAIKEQSQKECAPLCPECGAPMRKMMCKKGVNAGREFWGCTRYPECRGTRHLG